MRSRQDQVVLFPIVASGHAKQYLETKPFLTFIEAYFTTKLRTPPSLPPFVIYD